MEWAEVQALLARETRTPMGQELARALWPVADLAAIRRALGDTSEARAALGASGPPPWESIPDVRPTLEAVRVPGAVAEAAELAALIPLLDSAGRLRAYGRGIQPMAPTLATAFATFPHPKPLADLLRRCLDEDGTVRDEASPALRRLRQRIRDIRRELVKTLEGYFQSPGAEATFQERYVTVRHGRYVLPIRAEAKGRLRGIVHDRSQSGATLFVEPEGVVEANNELVQTAREEEAEVLRVLAELTDAVRAELPDLASLVDGIAALDLTFARAQLAERMEASEPAVGEGREVFLSAARNPLLLAQSWQSPDHPVVPMDLRLDAERPLLVITGPNAGGKTVALKTLGLLALMAQSGCHVPAHEGARLPCFSQVFAIVGDEQSVAENLSTFSAFVKHLREVLERVDDRSLVLLDELGAGTDPDDGAALAQAVLEELAGRGALCAASTHLEPLKGFASTFPKARNASVEFDPERLEPTFRLVYDRPGQSYALSIGARLGLPAHLIERAHSHRSSQQRQLQELLARLDDRDRKEAERAALLERREAESAGLLARAQAELETARKTARETVAKAKAEAQRLLGDIRRAVNEEWERLRKGEKSRAELERGLKRLRDVARDAEPVAGESASIGEARPAAAGDRVEISHLGLKGEVVSVDGQSATVQAGAVTVRVPLQALRVTGTPPHPTLSPKGERDHVPKGERDSDSGSPLPSGESARVRGGISLPGKSAVPVEMHLIGRTTDEARDLLEKYLDDAFLAGLGSVRIIHGKGTGALRRAVEEVLSTHPLVAEHRPGSPQEGGAGATVATLSHN
ncbi:MAG TPA: endonuclease MutS2 [Methylomirabilota bacterium]|nr:endonuclease MutS2 [Methylomirabilota bacterium]